MAASNPPGQETRSLVRWSSGNGVFEAQWPHQDIEVTGFSVGGQKGRGDGFGSSTPEVLVLPNSGTMVVPLLEGAALVGLLVMGEISWLSTKS
jgi:hypothetical protein